MAERGVDSGRAWLIAVAAHVCLALHEGIAKALGVMIPEITRDYQTEEWVIGLIIALMGTVGSFACLLIGPLTNKVSARCIVMTAGVSATTGVVLASWMTFSIPTFGAVLILLTGVSMRIAFVMSLAKVGQYFDRYHSIANSLVLIGSPTGVMICAPLSQYLILQYGWRGTLFIFGGMCANIIVCGAFLKEPYRERAPKRSYEANESLLHNSDEQDDEFEDTNNRKLEDTFGFFLFRNPKFLSLFAATLVAFFEWSGWLIYVVPHAEHKGLVAFKATALATAGGFGSLFGKLTIPALIDWGIISPTTVLFLGLSIAGVSLVIDPIVNDFIFLLILSSCFGFGFGIASLAIFVLVKTVARSEDLPKSLPWIAVAGGIARLMAGFFIGWLSKMTGNYNLSWVVMGVISFIGAVIIGLETIGNIVKYLGKLFRKIMVSPNQQ